MYRQTLQEKDQCENGGKTDTRLTLGFWKDD